MEVSLLRLYHFNGAYSPSTVGGNLALQTLVSRFDESWLAAFMHLLSRLLHLDVRRRLLNFSQKWVMRTQ